MTRRSPRTTNTRRSCGLMPAEKPIPSISPRRAGFWTRPVGRPVRTASGARTDIASGSCSRRIPPTSGAAGILANAKYDRALSGWIGGIDPDDSVRFMCRSFPPDGANYTRYCSKEMDAAQNVALEHYDEATRKKAYAKIQALIFRDMPQDFLWWPRQIQAVSVDFKGFDPNPVNEAWNSWEWEI